MLDNHHPLNLCSAHPLKEGQRGHHMDPRGALSFIFYLYINRYKGGKEGQGDV